MSIPSINSSKTVPFSPPNENYSYIESCINIENSLRDKSKNTLNDAIKYIGFLKDLNRFEDAYKTTDELARFFPALEHSLGLNASLTEDVTLLEKHAKSYLNEDADSNDWVILILLHHLKGTIDELAYGKRPLPKARDEKALLYFCAKDYQKVFSLLKERDKLSDLEYWILFISCQKLNYSKHEEECLNHILEKNLTFPINHISLECHEALVSIRSPVLRNNIQIYLKKRREKHPYSIDLLRSLSKLSSEPEATKYLSYAMVLQNQFTTPRNSVLHFLDSPRTNTEKFYCLLEIFKRYPIISVFHELQKLVGGDALLKAKMLEVCVSSARLYFIIYDAANRTIEKDDVEAGKKRLEIIETLLVISPHNKELLLKEASILIEIRENARALEIIL